MYAQVESSSRSSSDFAPQAPFDQGMSESVERKAQTLTPEP
jgi:hypothetical protein